MRRTPSKRKDSVPQARSKGVPAATQDSSGDVSPQPEQPIFREWRNRIVGTGIEDAAQLLANPRNWRIHPKVQQDALSGVLREVGWVQNVIVNQRTGYVVDGHARVALAISQGGPVPVVYVDLDENEEAIILASLDPLAGMAVTDKDLLGAMLKEITVNDEDLRKMLAGLATYTGITDAPFLGLTDEDAAPEPPAEPTTVCGDVWLLGRHRLMCGDATDVTAVERLMNGAKADLCITDPPYNVDYTGKTKDALKIMGDRKDDTDFVQFLRDAYASIGLAVKDGASVYVFHADTFGHHFRQEFISAGFHLSGVCVWRKQTMVMGRSDFHWQHEPILYGWKEGHAHGWYGDRKQTTVWDFDRPLRSTEHPTMKPVMLLEYPLGLSSKSGDLVLDLFGGSGSTLIVCQKNHRTAALMEIDPKYCDVIIKRFQDFTGEDACLETTGRTFNEVSQPGNRFLTNLGVQDAIKEEVLT